MPGIFWFGLFAALAILLVNLTVLWVLKTEANSTLINQLIGLDCVVGLFNIPIVLSLSEVTDVLSALCAVNRSYTFFITIFNRLLPIGIVAFRYVYVCNSTWVWTVRQRKYFHFLIILSIFSLTGSLTFFSFVYRYKNRHYLECIGQLDRFYAEAGEDSVLVWLLPPFSLPCNPGFLQLLIHGSYWLCCHLCFQ